MCVQGQQSYDSSLDGGEQASWRSARGLSPVYWQMKCVEVQLQLCSGITAANGRRGETERQMSLVRDVKACRDQIRDIKRRQKDSCFRVPRSTCHAATIAYRSPRAEDMSRLHA
jgi:hypothetical protein